jgi:hypothetical protein
MSFDPGRICNVQHMWSYLKEGVIYVRGNGDLSPWVLNLYEITCTAVLCCIVPLVTIATFKLAASSTTSIWNHKSLFDMHIVKNLKSRGILCYNSLVDINVIYPSARRGNSYIYKIMMKLKKKNVFYYVLVEWLSIISISTANLDQHINW